MFSPNRYVLIIGAVMSMVGSFMAVVLNQDAGVWICGLSNIFLVWYAYTAVVEFYQNLLILFGQSSEE